MKETIDMAKNKLRLVYNPNSPPTPKNWEMHKQMVEQGLISEDEIEDENLITEIGLVRKKIEN